MTGGGVCGCSGGVAAAEATVGDQRQSGGAQGGVVRGILVYDVVYAVFAENALQQWGLEFLRRLLIDWLATIRRRRR